GLPAELLTSLLPAGGLGHGVAHTLQGDPERSPQTDFIIDQQQVHGGRSPTPDLRLEKLIYLATLMPGCHPLRFPRFGLGGVARCNGHRAFCTISSLEHTPNPAFARVFACFPGDSAPARLLPCHRNRSSRKTHEPDNLAARPVPARP